MTFINSFYKTTLETFAYNPADILCFMFWVNWFEKSKTEIWKKIYDFPIIFASSLGFVIPTSILIYRFVPVGKRVLISTLFGIGWDTWMSYATHNDLRKVEI